jgi:hyperosmotically inducible protein
MNRIKKFLTFSLAVIAISMAGFSSNATAMTDAKPERTVEQKVFRTLLSLPRYGVFDFIQYEIQGSTVVLSGKVITLGTKRDAENAVKHISGITNVVNNIEELPIGSFDNDIRRAAYATFVDRGPAQYFSTLRPDVRIIVENGRITLEGYVARRSDSNTLNILAHGIGNVFSVKNNLVVGERTF